MRNLEPIKEKVKEIFSTESGLEGFFKLRKLLSKLTDEESDEIMKWYEQNQKVLHQSRIMTASKLADLLQKTVGNQDLETVVYNRGEEFDGFIRSISKVKVRNQEAPYYTQGDSVIRKNGEYVIITTGYSSKGMMAREVINRLREFGDLEVVEYNASEEADGIIRKVEIMVNNGEGLDYYCQGDSVVEKEGKYAVLISG